MKCFAWLALCLLFFLDSYSQNSQDTTTQQNPQDTTTQQAPRSGRPRAQAAQAQRQAQQQANNPNIVRVSKTGVYTGNISTPVEANAALICDSSAMVTASTAAVKSFREDLVKSISQAIDAITDNSNDQYAFYKWLYNEANIGDMADQLEKIKKSIEDPSKWVNIPAGDLYYQLDILLKGILAGDYPYFKVKRNPEAEKISFTIERTEPVHALLTKYYNNLVKSPEKS